MKQFITITLLVIPLLGFGQTNLFPNPSFEQYTECPTQQFNITSCTGFYDANANSSDFLHQCADSLPWPDNGFALPHCFWGYQYARTGEGCGGFASWLTGQRDYIEAVLSDTLQKDSTYRLRFYLNLANEVSWSTYGCVGAYFTDTLLYYNTLQHLPLAPHGYNPLDAYITDTLGWTLVEWEYTAHGGERYVTIGNFFDNVATQYLLLDSTNQDPYFKPYFYIDDLSLVLKSELTSINNLSAIPFSVFPNLQMLSPRFNVPLRQSCPLAM